MMTKTIIFDYDGTIHHTLGIYEPAFRETYQWLTEQKVAEEREIGSAEIAGWLGFNSKEMWIKKTDGFDCYQSTPSAFKVFKYLNSDLLK